MLRKLALKDIPYMLEWMHDPTINCHFRKNFSDITEEQVRQFIEHSYTDTDINFAFTDDNDEYKGTISLKNISSSDKNAEYAIVTRKEAQGKNYAFRATVEILQFAFEQLHLHKVYLNVLETNERANHFYRKAGFVYEGTAKEQLLLNGIYQNLNWYGMTEQQFKELYKQHQ